MIDPGLDGPGPVADGIHSRARELWLGAEKTNFTGRVAYRTTFPAATRSLVYRLAFGPGIDLLRPDNANRKLVESLVAQGVRVDVCLNTVDTIERETGKRPDFIPVATPVQVGVGQILSLTENGYTLVRP